MKLAPSIPNICKA